MTLMPTDQERRIQRVMETVMHDRWVVCPTSGRILDVMTGDDKALCGCGRSNPRVPAERTAETGTHIARFCEPSTVDAWLDQFYADKVRRAARLS